MVNDTTPVWVSLILRRTLDRLVRLPDAEQLPVVYMIDASVAITGALVAARQAARALHGKAHTVLVLPTHHAVPKEELHDFYKVETTDIPPISKNIRSLLRYIPLLIRGTWRVRSIMRRDGATQLWVNDFYLMHGVLLRVLGFRGRLITCVRCDPVRFAGPLARPMLWLAARASQRMVAVSRFIQQRILPRIASEIVYDYYAENMRAPKQLQATDKKIFLMVGHYIRGKGQDIALMAFLNAAAQDPTIRLHFYGGDMGLQKNRDYRAELEAFVKQSTYADRVEFHDALVNAELVRAGAYAALNFSDSESFSMTVLEASGAGVPVIATASGGPQEIIVDGVTGYLIPVRDANAACARILDLAQNPALAEAMGLRAAQHVQQYFNMNVYTRQLYMLLGF